MGGLIPPREAFSTPLSGTVYVTSRENPSREKCIPLGSLAFDSLCKALFLLLSMLCVLFSLYVFGNSNFESAAQNRSIGMASGFQLMQQADCHWNKKTASARSKSNRLSRILKR